jgi:hypothetical protein
MRQHGIGVGYSTRRISRAPTWTSSTSRRARRAALLPADRPGL